MNKYLLKLGEIVLKGRNRFIFEKRLKENLKQKLNDDIISLKNWGGVFYLETKKDVSEDLKKFFGIRKIGIAQEFILFEDLKNFLFKMPFLKYNFEVKRADKNYPLNSLEIKQKIIDILKTAGKIFDSKEKIKFTIEYRDGKFFYLENIDGPGGLPVGSSGKGLALLSAGFDSPVASYLAMKRGLKVVFLHFHSYPQTGKEVLEAIENLVKILSQYNLSSELYLMNILELQKFYFQNIPKEYLVIFYRRSMFRLAEKLAQEVKAKTLITGENLGQVASQTVENLSVISEATNLFVFRPLLGFNKEEIIELSKKIGTFEISQKKFEDCCSLFIPEKVKTKAKLETIKKIEEKIYSKINKLEINIFSKKEYINYHPYFPHSSSSSSSSSSSGHTPSS